MYGIKDGILQDVSQNGYLINGDSVINYNLLSTEELEAEGWSELQESIPIEKVLVEGETTTELLALESIAEAMADIIGGATITSKMPVLIVGTKTKVDRGEILEDVLTTYVKLTTDEKQEIRQKLSE